VGTRSRPARLVLALAACTVAGSLGVAGCGSAAKPSATAPKAGAHGNRLATHPRNVLISNPLTQAIQSPAHATSTATRRMTIRLYRKPNNPSQYQRFCESSAARAVAQSHVTNPEAVQWLKRACLRELNRSH